MMSLNLIAEILLTGMPYSMAIKGIVFLGLWIILIRQDASDSLPRWINRFFFMLFLMSMQITWMAGYVNVYVDNDDVNVWAEWEMIVGMNILPLLTAGSGIMVAIRAQQGNTRDTINEARFSTDVAETIVETRNDVAEVKADVKDLRHRMDGS